MNQFAQHREHHFFSALPQVAIPPRFIVVDDCIFRQKVQLRLQYNPLIAMGSLVAVCGVSGVLCIVSF